LVLIFLLAEFHRPLHCFCSSKITITCKNYCAGMFLHNDATEDASSTEYSSEDLEIPLEDLEIPLAISRMS